MADFGIGETIAIVGIMASAAGAAASMSASSAAGEAQAKQMQFQADQMRYQAAVAQNNKVVADQNADFQRQQAQNERDVATTQEQQRLIEAGQQTAHIRAIAGAAGVDPNSGTPVALQSDSQKFGTLDALTIRSNAERRAYGDEIAALGYENQGANFDANANLANYSADFTQAGESNARAAAGISATSSLLSGASSVGSKWNQYRKDYPNGALA